MSGAEQRGPEDALTAGLSIQHAISLASKLTREDGKSQRGAGKIRITGCWYNETGFSP